MKILLCFAIIFSSIFYGSQCRKSQDISKQKTELDSECVLIKDIEWSMNEVNKDRKAFSTKYSRYDNCYLSFIDTLTNEFILNSNVAYIRCLNQLATVSDGYVAEYFAVEVLKKLTAENFVPFFTFLYNETRSNNDTALETFFVESIVIDIQDTEENNSSMKRTEIETELSAKLSSENQSNEKTAYLKKIFNKVKSFLKKSNK